MTLVLVLGVVAATTLGTLFSALYLSLKDASRTDLERRLEARYGEDAPSPEWLFARMTRIEASVSLLRIICQVGVVVMMTAILGHDGGVWTADVGELIFAASVSTLIVWISTSVLAAAIARHVGDVLVATSLPFMRVMGVILRPFTVLASFIDEVVRRLSGANLRAKESEEELLRSIEDTQREGGLDQAAAEMIENVVEFSSTDVGEVMTPRTDIAGLEITNDLSLISAFIADVGHSRIPVYRENLDDIIGILYVKDLVPFLGVDPEGFDLERQLRQPIRIPETKPVGDLLADFQRSEVHLAIVIDEYGGTAGLVTIEDVLEEIVGEIQDEHDSDDEEMPEISMLEPNYWEIDGRVHIDDLNEDTGMALSEDEDYDTVAGFVLATIGRVPNPGEGFEHDGFKFEVVAAEPTFIERIRVRRLEDE